MHSHEAQVIDLSLTQAIERYREMDADTQRELQVVSWTARGKTGWEIAQILGVTDQTVKKHLQSAAEKLGAHNKTHASVIAALRGLVKP